MLKFREKYLLCYAWSITSLLWSGCGASPSQNLISTSRPVPNFNTQSQTWARDICGNQTWLDNFQPPFEWMPVLNTADEFGSDLVGLSGRAIVLRSGISDRDVPFTHPFGFDWEFYVAPDAPYTALFAPSNTDRFANDPNAAKFLKPDGEYATAMAHGRTTLQLKDLVGVMGVETDQDLIPNDYR